MRIAVLFALAVASILTSGCSLCAPGHLNDYAGVGGKWQRSDPENGRVGSLFSDPDSQVATSNAAVVVDGDSYYSDEAFEPDSTEYGESIMESPDLGPGGVIILGEDWGPE